MAPSRRTLAIGAIPAAAAGAAWALQRRADHRRIEADPLRPALLAPLSGRRLPVRGADGTPLNVEVFGPDGAPTVVLVHGWTCAIRFWTLQIQELSKRFRVVAYDLRGHGESGMPAGHDYSTDAFADDLDAVLAAALPDGERAVVAGHSLGAMTLVACSARHPDRIRSSVAAAALVATGMGDLVSESLLLRTPAPLAQVKSVAGRVLLSAAAPMPKESTPISHRAIRYIALSASASPAAVAFCEEIVLECRREVRAACGGTLTRLDLNEAVAGLDVPTVVLAGERDRLTPPVHARRMADALPQLVELVEAPGAGHMLPVEAPELVSGRIAELADSHLGGRLSQGQVARAQ